MPFEPGHQKLGGRKTGTPNRKTSLLNETLEDLGLNVPSKIVEILPQLPLEKQAGLLLGLMQFLYPKRKSIEVKAEIESQPPPTEEEIKDRLLKILDYLKPEDGVGFPPEVRQKLQALLD